MALKTEIYQLRESFSDQLDSRDEDIKILKAQLQSLSQKEVLEELNEEVSLTDKQEPEIGVKDGSSLSEDEIYILKIIGEHGGYIKEGDVQSYLKSSLSTSKFKYALNNLKSYDFITDNGASSYVAKEKGISYLVVNNLVD